MKMDMIKRIFTLNALLAVMAQALAQGPNGSGTYYQQADGKTGSGLKTAMAAIIGPHKQLGYDDLWDAFRSTDCRPDGKVWDMYSCATSYTFVSKGTTYKKEGDCYNREHSMPKSWFNNGYPMYTDLVHLVPTDGYVNGRRSNYPFGETDGERYKSEGDFSKLGQSTVSGYEGTVFEPNDEYKGDFARIYFYMATCYEDKISGWSIIEKNGNQDNVHSEAYDVFAGNAYPAYTQWTLDLLMRWADEDPVSQKEIDRNNAVYGIQGNRNPYVDYPGLEDYVWGDKQGMAFSYTTSPTGINAAAAPGEATEVDVYTITGVKVRSGVNKGKATEGLGKGIYIVGKRKCVVE